ncbi:protease synthase and sporulation negative regulatory protein PAI 1 [Janthinobacterium sp. HH107]|uniref:GNAT family N-acetyltransferase n=1 Tax=Janthinobacterium sp. HH107 TaxID=1537279 RepID=UPI00087411AC|nr:GNAT family N-acetyltransferase [Janthinobacterium sp. HH107]OFA01346.1 protease synthase and sporulation negative regulatory protein PAI 1 [Janthinobacterium sp. HH107]
MASDVSGDTDSAIAIRPCVKGDEQALALVGQATFLEAFAGILDGADVIAHCQRQHDAQLYRDWLALPAMRLWLAEAMPGGAPVGYLVLSPASLPVADPRPDDLEIKRIYLLHRFQGRRVGQRLMQAALSQARAGGAGRVLLGVYAENHDALAFYARCGFAQVGRRTFRVGRTDYQDVILGMTM